MRDNDLSSGFSKEYVFAMVDAFADLMRSEMDKAIDDITWRQYEALVFVREFSKYKIEYTGGNVRADKTLPSLQELATDMMTPRQNVKKIITSLQKKGLVMIVTDDEDRKKQLIMITDLGESYLDNRKSIIRLLDKAFCGIDERELQNFVGTINKVTDNIKDRHTIGLSVSTCDNKKRITATIFRKTKVLPRRKNRPLYEIRASNGALFEISGINRFIVGFYTTEEAADKELEEIYKAMRRGESEYELKYNCAVKFDFSGMPLVDE